MELYTLLMEDGTFSIHIISRSINEAYSIKDKTGLIDPCVGIIRNQNSVSVT